MMKDTFDAVINGATREDRVGKATELASTMKAGGVAKSVHELKLNVLLAPFLTNTGKKAGPQREAACLILSQLFQQCPGSSLLMVPSYEPLMTCMGAKQKPVATAAAEAMDAMFNELTTFAPSLMLTDLLKPCEKNATLSQLTMLNNFSTKCPNEVPNQMLQAIKSAAEFTNDLKGDVAEMASAALTAVCETCINPDMDQFIPELVECMKDMSKIPDTVNKMAGTTFISEVEIGTLSIMEPVLSNGLGTKSTTAIKRQCARIIENFAKLIDEPRHLFAFMPSILPLLEVAAEKEKDSECRDVCRKAAETLTKKQGAAVPLTFDWDVSRATFFEAMKEFAPEAAEVEHFQPVYDIIINQCAQLNRCEIDEADTITPWMQSVVPALTLCAQIDEAAATKIAEKIRETSLASKAVVVEEEEVDDDAEVLCDLQFGLAYGNKVLLRKTNLKLLRGHKYGLLGQNDSGKTSLLQSLADYKIDGFPTIDECRTVFVATDIKTELADFSVIDYMYNDPLLKDSNITKDAMEAMLKSVGFEEGKAANTTQKVGTLSGGWRMKLALCRALLLKADILLLDEPTNHLDAYNVKWVETYLQSLTHVTCIMVSHDSGLLTRVCTDIIEIEDLKLRFHRGNLTTFVEKKPEAKAYFEISKEKGKVEFNFPTPGELPGVKSKGKAILKMSDVSFTYPGAAKAQLNNVSVQVSLSSRVACVGENGAGKSTMIKLLTGELEPDEGSGDIWKHPNCRVGYIAQHAFHHIEKHLEQTPNEYIRWRFQNGGDREEEVKVSSIASPEEIEQMELPFEIPFLQEDGSIVKIGYVVKSFTEKRRANKKKEDEYECHLAGPFSKNKAGKFVGSADGATKLGWVARENLYRNGFEKVVKAMDDRIAMRATTFARPLTKENVQTHLAEVGLAPEFGTHVNIGALSGGQKVKVVLAAALWMQPHILILDEPTNYLDRESLGALARAIHAFEGGVVLITHNSQFCDNVCPVVWHLHSNRLDVKGDAEWMAEAAKAEVVVAKIGQEDLVDKFGNTIELSGKKGKTKKELKQKKLRRKRRAKETGEDYDSSDEDY